MCQTVRVGRGTRRLRTHGTGPAGATGPCPLLPEVYLAPGSGAGTAWGTKVARKLGKAETRQCGTEFAGAPAGQGAGRRGLGPQAVGDAPEVGGSRGSAHLGLLGSRCLCCAAHRKAPARVTWPAGTDAVSAQALQAAASTCSFRAVGGPRERPRLGGAGLGESERETAQNTCANHTWRTGTFSQASRLPEHALAHSPLFVTGCQSQMSMSVPCHRTRGLELADLMVAQLRP